MTDQIEQLFQQARETEVVLPEKQFMTAFKAELKASSESDQRSPASYDWILMVAAVLAVAIAFIVTPMSFWLSAIPYLSFSFETLVLMSFGVFVAAMSCFWLFDKDPI